ncbi:MAG: radical SAM protein [Nitrososphaerales archaeon]
MTFSEPIHIAWQCTYECNLECIHCYAAYNPHELLTNKEARNLIKQAYEIGAKSFVFTGGEPLLRPDILELAKFVKDSGMTPVIATNATLMTPEHIKSFKESKASIAINLPTLIEETHVKFTRISSSLSKKMVALNALLREGLSVSVGAVVTSVNIDDVEGVIHFAESRGLTCDVLATIPMGRAKSKILPKLHSYKNLMTRLFDKWHALPMNAIGYKEFSKVSVYEPSYSALMSSRGFEVPGRLCSLSQTMHVMEDGSVRPCPYIPYSLGNVMKNDLKDIWRRLKKDKFLQGLCDVDRVKGKCSKCSFKEVCGGCRARAYWMLGDYFAEDKVCILDHVSDL